MIRPYHDNDLPGLLETWSMASAVAHPFLSNEFIAAERENIPKLYLPNAETWVFEENGQITGFIALIGNEVGAIFVRPDCHRRGIGQQLMDKAQKERGTLEVDVFTANLIGRSFYTKYGFQFVEEKFHEPSGQNLMRLKLA